MPEKILFIIIDQLRADCTSGALADEIDIPNIRALMSEGVTFNRYYTNTVPCGPSRASLLTGLYAMNHRSINNGTPLSAAHPTIATQMRKAGYDPLLFGYTDASIDPANVHPNDPELTNEEGIAPGFSEIVRMRFQDSASWLGYLNEKGYDLPDIYWQLYQPKKKPNGDPGSITDPAIYSAEDSDTAFLTNQTLRELHPRSHQNWFATLTYIRPHPPLIAPAPYNSRYAPEKLSKPIINKTIDAQKASHPFFKACFSKPTIPYLYLGFNGRIDHISDQTAAELRAVYLGLITEVDHHIGRVLQFLRDSGQYDDTLIVFTADHGEMLGDHHMWGKYAPYDAAFHVPLIIRDPKNRSTAGTRVNAYAEAVDIAPTLLDWVGEKPPAGFNGKSLLPWLAGKTPENWRTHYFAEMDLGDPHTQKHYQTEFGVKPQQCNVSVLQDEQYKLVYFNGGVAPMLFDINKDPDETADLAQNPNHQNALTSMIRKLLDHRMTYAHHALSRMKLTASGLKQY